MKSVDGYVAFLDVLGFSDLVARDDSLSEIQRYVSAIQAAVSNVKAEGQLLALFSDSIILTNPSLDDTALQRTIESCSRIFGALLELKVPVRGAISSGRFIYSDDTLQGTIVAGRPLTEAYQWERQQDWVGITLAPSVTRRHPSLDRLCNPRGADVLDRLPWVLHLGEHRNIPFHSNTTDDKYMGYAVIPYVDIHTFTQLREKVQQFISTLWSMKYVASDPSAQGKCQAAIAFLQEVTRLWGGDLEGALVNRKRLNSP